MNHPPCRCIVAAGLALLAACWTPPPIQPFPPERRDSPFHAAVIEARPAQVVVRADRPMAWLVIEVGPLGELQMLYADTVSSSIHPDVLVDTLQLDPRSRRLGLGLGPDASPRFSYSCLAQSTIQQVNPETGLVTAYSGPCVRVGASFVTPASRAFPGYWLAIGSSKPAPAAAIEQMLRKAPPVPEPARMASVLAIALFGNHPPEWDYAAVRIPAPAVH